MRLRLALTPADSLVRARAQGSEVSGFSGAVASKLSGTLEDLIARQQNQPSPYKHFPLKELGACPQRSLHDSNVRLSIVLLAESVFYKQIKFDVVTKKLLDNNTELKENKEGKFDQKHVLDESGSSPLNTLGPFIDCVVGRDQGGELAGDEPEQHQDLPHSNHHGRRVQSG